MQHLKTALGLTALGGIAWVLMAVPLPHGQFPERPWVMPLAGVFLSFLLFATIVQASVGRPESDEPRSPTGGSAPLGTVVTVAGLILMAGVAVQKVELVPALLVYLTGSAALFLLASVLDHLRRSEPFGYTSHWGGLGGSLGGWSLSPGAVLAVFIVIFLGAAIAIGIGAAPPGETGNVEAQNRTSETEAANETTTANTATPANESSTAGANDPEADPAQSNGAVADAANAASVRNGL